MMTPDEELESRSGVNDLPTTCRNCGLPIEPIFDPWGGQHGWHHPTVEREANIDGVDVRIYATSCPNEQGEAEPIDAEDILER
jgi:hypothetical protein